MIRIAISEAAFEAIARTLPFGGVSYENATNEWGERRLARADGCLSPQSASRPWRELERRDFAGCGGGVMAKTNDIARLIVDEFEAIEDYRLKDHVRIVAKIERTVRARYPGLKSAEWEEAFVLAQRINRLLEPPTDGELAAAGDD